MPEPAIAPAPTLDVLVLDAAEPLAPEARARLERGSGVVLVGTGAWHEDARRLAAEHAITVTPGAPERGVLRPDPAVDAVTDQDLLARVGAIEGTRTADLVAGEGAAALLRSPSGRAAVVVARTGRGRAAVVALEDPAATGARELVRNAVAWTAPPAPPRADRTGPDPLVGHPAWTRLKAAVARVAVAQASDGTVPEPTPEIHAAVETAAGAVEDLAPLLPHDAAYLAAVAADLRRWASTGLGTPDFLDSLVAFAPQRHREDGLRHLVVAVMYTQNGSPDRHLEAVLVEVVWPDFVAEQEAGPYSNKLFVPIRFLDFSAGYDTNAAVLFPETFVVRETPTFTWGAIFCDREAARFRTVVRAAADITRLALPPDAARLIADQDLAEETFVLWDLIHDRTHMRGDLPFDPFMVKQRMPYFLYGLEELRCDLTAFREAVALEEQGLEHGRLVQYGVIFDRIFRFAVTGDRHRNYDGLAGQLLFAWLHQHHVLHWTDNRLSIEWERVPAAVLELGRRIEDLYWRSIDRPKVAHWLAAYELVRETLTPHPASLWAKGPDALPLTGTLKELNDSLLPDEFPLSMFYEALARKTADVVAATRGITGRSAVAGSGA